jgi:hypothetical protein
MPTRSKQVSPLASAIIAALRGVKLTKVKFSVEGDSDEER